MLPSKVVENLGGFSPEEYLFEYLPPNFSWCPLHGCFALLFTHEIEKREDVI
jgi:hypothetical protein